MRLLADGELRVAALERKAAGRDADEPNHHAQKRGFSGAITAANRQALTGGDGKIHVREDIAAAAPAGQIGGGKPHQQRTSASNEGPDGCAAASQRVRGTWHIIE